MQEKNLSYLTVDADVIEIDVHNYLYEMDNIEDTFNTVVQILERTAEIFSSGSAEVNSKPRVYIGGKPAELGEKTVKCPYCGTTAVIGKDTHCPNCSGVI